MTARDGNRGRGQPAGRGGSLEDPVAGVKLELTSPRAVFADLMTCALESSSVQPSPCAVSYLIGMMELQVRAGTCSPGLAATAPTAPTFAEALLTAISEGGCDEKLRLRDLGDRALFVSGFFGESLHGGRVGPDYYQSVGRTAYRRLSAQLARSVDDRSWRELFQELADEFGAFVELLAEVGGRARPDAPVDLLRLYDRYLLTGSSSDRARLAREGVVPPPADSLGRRQ